MFYIVNHAVFGLDFVGNTLLYLKNYLGNRLQIFFSISFLIFLCFLLQFIQRNSPKKPRFSALPVLNMPKRTHDSTKPKPRTPRSVVQDHFPLPQKAVYKNFRDLSRRTLEQKSLRDWNLKLMTDRLVVKKMLDTFLIPEFEIIIDDTLGFTINVFECFLPEDHALYLENLRSVRHVTVSELVKKLESYKLCSGV